MDIRIFVDVNKSGVYHLKEDFINFSNWVNMQKKEHHGNDEFVIDGPEQELKAIKRSIKKILT